MQIRDTFRRGQRIVLALVVVLSIGLTGCSGQQADPTGQSVEAGSPLALPRPSAIRLPSSVAEYSLRGGTDYSDELPHRHVLRDGVDAVFTPRGGDSFDDSAYATYPFHLESFNNNITLRTIWHLPPPLPLEKSCWIGLADWESDSWTWVIPDSPTNTVIDPLHRFVRESDSLLLIVVVCIGNSTMRLNSLQLGWEDPSAVESIWPLIGDAGSELQFSAEVRGSEPMSFAWDFGAAAIPSSSDEDSPTVTLGGPGLYDCKLTISNPDGKYRHSFQLRVNDSDHWLNFYEADISPVSSLVAGDCSVDSEGNLAVTGWYGEYQKPAPTTQGLFVLKSTPSGALLWAKSWGPEVYLLSSKGKGVAVDGEDNTYVVGGYQYDAFSEIPTAALIIKLDADGNCLWDRIWNSGIDVPEARSVAVAPDGSIVVIGYSGNREVQQRLDLFILKLSSDGDLLWQKLWEISDEKWYRQSVDLAIDSAGIAHVVVEGIHNSGEVRNSAYLKLDASGNVLSSSTLVDFLVQSIAVAGDGAVYLSGCDSPGGGYDQTTNVALWKLDSSGKLVWSLAHPYENVEWPEAEVAVGPSSQIGFTCSCRGRDEWNRELFDTIVMQLNPDGVGDWVQTQLPYYAGNPIWLAYDAGGDLRAIMSSIYPDGLWQDTDFTLESTVGVIQAGVSTSRNAVGAALPAVGTTTSLDARTNIGANGLDTCVTKF